MKKSITYMSDLHWEFDEIMPQQTDARLKGGDILVLAGDICPVNKLNKMTHLDYFIEKAVERFNNVFAIKGNHEDYHGIQNDTTMIRKFYSSRGVVFLDNEVTHFHPIEEKKTKNGKIEREPLLNEWGPKIVAGTFWTDMNRDNPITKQVVKGYMNDFRHIYKLDGSVWTPDDAVAENKKMRDLIELHQPKVVISHHAPSSQSVHPRYQSQTDGNYGYYSDYIPPDSVELWIHGHMHDSFDYIHKGNGITRVVCNPRGYRGHDRNVHFEFDKSVEIDL